MLARGVELVDVLVVVDVDVDVVVVVVLVVVEGRLTLPLTMSIQRWYVWGGSALSGPRKRLCASGCRASRRAAQPAPYLDHDEALQQLRPGIHSADHAGCFPHQTQRQYHDVLGSAWGIDGGVTRRTSSFWGEIDAVRCPCRHSYAYPIVCLMHSSFHLQRMIRVSGDRSRTR